MHENSRTRPAGKAAGHRRQARRLRTTGGESAGAAAAKRDRSTRVMPYFGMMTLSMT